MPPERRRLHHARVAAVVPARLFASRPSVALGVLTRPENGGTTIDSTQAVPEQVVLGDLYFESPSGLWERGTYTLVIHRPDVRSGCRSNCDREPAPTWG